MSESEEARLYRHLRELAVSGRLEAFVALKQLDFVGTSDVFDRLVSESAQEKD